MAIQETKVKLDYRNLVAVLGASDPEMEEIKAIAGLAGVETVQAVCAGKPVFAGNAYSADGPAILDLLIPSGKTAVLVECGGPSFETRRGDSIIVDHHKPGDKGYGKLPTDFLAASSVGQFVSLLVWAGWVPPWQAVDSSLYNAAKCFDGELLLAAGGWAVFSKKASQAFYIPQDIVLAAAADHCLAAAYRGLCPSVDPDALMTWRISSRAAFQNRPVEAILADVEAARKVLAEARSAGREYADLRGQQIPELPEAAAREGFPFISTVVERDGRTKVVLQAAPAELVSRFMRGEVVPGLTGLYGDPARGFAGGYVEK